MYLRCKERREEEVDAVLVGTDNNRLVGLAGECGNDRVLTPSMLEMFDTCSMLQSSCVCEGVIDLAQQPE
mgnify:CR=1 FL=1